MIFNLNYEELIELKKYIDYFDIVCLNDKINIIIDLIHNSIIEQKKLINVKTILSSYL